MAMSTRFDKLYSVELDEKLYRCAGQRLSHKTNIHLFHGDSGDILCEILTCCQQPAIFWLDAHYSGEGTASGPLKTPILHELTHILSDKSSRHIILIDDARYFNGINDYPTIGEIHRIVRQFRPEYNVEIEKDIIRIVPDKQPSLNGMNSVHSPARTYVAS
ncbi:MAG: hypothetical protein JXA82_16295 [Sedimentisphaerales bacterium]|nr:hypothetical protein [Sedimentisphaerales bacterium]